MDEAASTPAWQKTEGHPIDGQVLYKALGIYQTQEQVDNTPHIDGAKPGDLIYQDTNGDGNITWDDAIRIDETATPKIIYGIYIKWRLERYRFKYVFPRTGQSQPISPANHEHGDRFL